MKDEFFKRFNKTDGCWEWSGQRWAQGYGRFKHKRKERKAHRVSWEIHNGPIPEGMMVCHKCDNPPCVRPDHLFLGTAKDNVRDMLKKGRDGFSGDKSWLRRHPEKIPRGESLVISKLTSRAVAEIRRLHKIGIGQLRISKIFCVSKPTITAVLRGETWKHV